MIEGTLQVSGLVHQLKILNDSTACMALCYYLVVTFKIKVTKSFSYIFVLLNYYKKN